MKFKIIFTTFIVLLSFAFARVTFEQSSFDTNTFNDHDKMVESCAAPASASFWCELLDSTLAFIPTKGVDYFFNDAGEMVALYSKQQKGKDFARPNAGARSPLKAGQNLIPTDETNHEVASGRIESPKHLMS